MGWGEIHTKNNKKYEFLDLNLSGFENILLVFFSIFTLPINIM